MPEKTEEITYDGFFRKCEGCKKVCDCVLIATYNVAGSIIGFLKGKKLLKLQAGCKECGHISGITEEEAKEKAMPLIYKKMIKGER